MNDNTSDQVIDGLNLPANKKAKAIQKRRAAENSYEALQLKKAAAIYLRVSSEMQVDGFSIEAQKIACLKYANEQGYEVTDSHIYIDEAYSAKNEDRPEFKRLMTAAHSSEFSLIIIHKMDRFERNFRAMTNTLEDLANIGVRVYSIHENLELANTLTVNLFGIINEHYIQNLSWETAKGKHQAAKEGYFIGSRVPFGYRKWKVGDPPEMDKRLLFIDEKEGPALQHCFEMYATGNYSFEDLADYLNSNGFISRSGKAFRKDTLRSMLENPIYIGIIEYQGVKKDSYLTYKGKHQPLVSTELFNQVAAIREIKGNEKCRIRRDNTELKEKYMVQNLICCETCIRRLRVRTTYNNDTYNYYYRDFSEDRGLECKDSKKIISAIYVEGLVLSFLSSIILPRNWIDKIIAYGSENDTYAEINEQINKLKSRMERRCEAYTVSGVYQNYEKYERDQKTDQNLIDELTKRLPKDSAIVNTQITLTSSLIDLFLRATKSERYDIVHYLFLNIYIDLNKHQLTGFEPKPEFDFLFSTFAEDNGWKKEGNRFLISAQRSSSYNEFLKNKSREEEKRKSEAVQAYCLEAAKQGFFVGGKAPFGYKKNFYPIEGNQKAYILTPDPSTANVVRKCFEMYASGKYTYKEIAIIINKMNLKTKENKTFSDHTIFYMLSNQTYLGLIVYKGKEIFPGKHEAIISKDLWNRVQEIKKMRSV